MTSVGLCRNWIWGNSFLHSHYWKSCRNGLRVACRCTSSIYQSHSVQLLWLNYLLAIFRTIKTRICYIWTWPCGDKSPDNATLLLLQLTVPCVRYWSSRLEISDTVVWTNSDCHRETIVGVWERGAGFTETQAIAYKYNLNYRLRPEIALLWTTLRLVKRISKNEFELITPRWSCNFNNRLLTAIRRGQKNDVQTMPWKIDHRGLVGLPWLLDRQLVIFFNHDKQSYLLEIHALVTHAPVFVFPIYVWVRRKIS